MIVSESMLIACDVCENRAISYEVEYLYPTGAQRRHFFCEYHRPDGFQPAREQHDERYQRGYLLIAA